MMNRLPCRGQIYLKCNMFKANPGLGWNESIQPYVAEALSNFHSIHTIQKLTRLLVSSCSCKLGSLSRSLLTLTPKTSYITNVSLD